MLWCVDYTCFFWRWLVQFDWFEKLAISAHDTISIFTFWIEVVASLIVLSLAVPFFAITKAFALLSGHKKLSLSQPKIPENGVVHLRIIDQ